MKVREKVREILKPMWQDCGYDTFKVLGGKKWTVGKMSYDEYFLEPFRKGKKEGDSFDKNTLWEKSDFADILQLLVDEKLIRIL